VFRRRTDAAAAPGRGSARTPDVRTAVGAGTGSGKGRPTPKRREAEQQRRQRVRPTTDRREARRRQREAMRAERLRSRKAMLEGDERHYLPRDQGPVRGFIRDYVDSRRTIAEYFLPAVVIVLVASFIPNTAVQLFSYALWLASILLVVVDLLLLTGRLKRELRRRFPDDAGRGHTLYALARVTQMRRLRLPKPRVKPGTAV
jgi:hypothetical protein